MACAKTAINSPFSYITKNPIIIPYIKVSITPLIPEGIPS